jgi:hypothetical protein
MKCRYTLAWVGPCEKEAQPGLDVCSTHANKKCWCKKQAYQECSIAVTLVCGRPICNDHGCNLRGYGLTGVGAHDEQGEADYDEWFKEHGKKKQ